MYRLYIGCMLNSESMVLLHLKHKILCSWFLSHPSYSDFIYHVIEIPNHISMLKYKDIWKQSWSSEIILTNTTFRNKGSPFAVSKLKMSHGKNTVKSFVRENEVHAYLTRETLPAEERESKFHNHGKTPSCQPFAAVSVRKWTKFHWLDVRPRSTNDDFPSRVIIGNCHRKLSAIQIWRTIPVTPFAIYQQSSDVIKPDMNIVTCFACV